MASLRVSRFQAVFGIVAGFYLGHNANAADTAFPSDAEIRGILQDRIDTQRLGVGIVVGLVDSTGRRVLTYGNVGEGNSRQLSGDTVFEIGTTTKVFTALLLTDMAQHHEISLTDPVQKYIPRTVKMPERGRSMTLEDLATHTSGLPREPANLGSIMRDYTNPYADYTTKDLYAFLSSYQLQREVGSEWEYSNLGYAVLAHALSLRAGKSYEELVESRIAKPLGLQSTGITLTQSMAKRTAVGHNTELKPTSDWSFKALAGFGALRSTAEDLLTFLSAALGFSKSSLAPAMAAMLETKRPTNTPGLENALGWQISNFDGKEIIQKDGATFGYEAFMAYDRKARAGVVVLANAYTTTGVSDIGMHLLDPSIPLRGTKQRAISLDPKFFDTVVGTYKLDPDVTLAITRQENHLFADLTGQPRLEIFPQSERDFFFRVYDAQLHFASGSQGPASTVVLYRRGSRQTGVRVASSPAENK